VAVFKPGSELKEAVRGVPLSLGNPNYEALDKINAYERESLSRRVKEREELEARLRAATDESFF
jgi:hypothetical protein